MDQIKIIGFDLDQTLYPKSSKIDEAIQSYIYHQIATLKHVGIDAAKKLFADLYQNGTGLSGRKSLVTLGFSDKDADGIVQKAVECSNIESLLSPDLQVIELITKLGQKYTLDLITGSTQEIAKRKLEKLAIPNSLFKHLITGENASKTDLSAYKLWLSYYPHLSPTNFLYIGDRVSSDYEAPKQLEIFSILVNVKKDERYECPQLTSLAELETVLFASVVN